MPFIGAATVTNVPERLQFIRQRFDHDDRKSDDRLNLRWQFWRRVQFLKLANERWNAEQFWQPKQCRKPRLRQWSRKPKFQRKPVVGRFKGQ